ncbi:MAG: hemerythrin domain-containing protein [Nitrososphaerales archaeon]
MNRCHHGKEEQGLFPLLEQKGMPHNMGSIAVMIMEHERTKIIVEEIREEMKLYRSNMDDPSILILAYEKCIEHVSQHLWKENNRLFQMADTLLK